MNHPRCKLQNDRNFSILSPEKNCLLPIMQQAIFLKHSADIAEHMVKVHLLVILSSDLQMGATLSEAENRGNSTTGWEGFEDQCGCAKSFPLPP